MPRRTVADLLVVAWVILWLLLASAVVRDVDDLAQLGYTAVDVGRSTQRAGDAIASLDRLPLIGDAVRVPAEEVRRAGREAEASGIRSRRRTERFGLLLGLVVALVPVVPVLVVYLPGRLRGSRERRDVRDALADPARAAELEALLAWRAVAQLEPTRLLAATPTPLADLREGRHRALADAELARTGLSRPGR